MDAEVIRGLDEAGLDASLTKHVLDILVIVDENMQPRPVAEEVLVFSGGVEHRCPVRLRTISELYAGDARPLDFADGPAAGYEMFFGMVERTAADFCVSTGQMETDDEFARLYRLLARRPAGTDRNPLFSYMQAAARLYMSVRDVSRHEFEAVALRLSTFARNVRTGPSSRNYIQSARRLLRA